jgi:hypothetical protein
MRIELEINYVQKLAGAFRGEKHRAVCGRGGKRRFGNFLKCTSIRINGKHGDLAL